MGLINDLFRRHGDAYIAQFGHRITAQPGFMKIRYYGFLSSTSSVTLDTIRTLIELAHGFEMTTPAANAPVMAVMKCSHCGGTLRYSGFTLPKLKITTLPEHRPPASIVA